MQDSMDIDTPVPLVPIKYVNNRVQFTIRRSSSAPDLGKKTREDYHSKKTGYIYESAMLAHVHPTEDHPERPARILVIFQEMQAEGLITRARSIPFNPVLRREALLVHSEDHWNKVEQIAQMTRENILESVAYYEGLSLYVSPATTHAAKLSCGGVIEACRAVASGTIRNCFAIVRPPGHHAEPDEHMGFCFFNNCAVAARAMQVERKAKKVLILDWDVHHGNGTQKAFLDDPTVLYISLHRFDIYPGGQFGAVTSCGEGPGLGYSVNIAWPGGGMGDADYLYAFQKVVMPIAVEFAPDLVIVSAGFDAARGDDLGECDVTPAGYAHMTHMLSSLANGKLVVALEGGYNLDSIRNSAVAVMRVLMGEAPPYLLPMVASKAATETVYQTARVHARYWNNLNAPPLDARAIEDSPISTDIPTLLKEYRARQLYTHCELYRIPIADQELKSSFEGLALCSNDIMAARKMIFLIHNFGDLHIETLGEASCDIDLEKSYIMDASEQLVQWARRSGFSFIDLNVFFNASAYLASSKESRREAIALQRKMITYIWDNYVELLDDDCKVYLVAYAGASYPLSELFRSRDLTKRLAGVVQIVGQSQEPATLKHHSEAYDWFVKNSVIYTGFDPSDMATFSQRAGIGRAQSLSSNGGSIRGASVMQKCIPHLDELIKSGRPFGAPVPDAGVADLSGLSNGAAMYHIG